MIMSYITAVPWLLFPTCPLSPKSNIANANPTILISTRMFIVALEYKLPPTPSTQIICEPS